MDDDRHREYVGVSNRPILENLEALNKLGSNVWIRVPLIPGVNDDQKNIDATAAFVASLDKPYPVHLLPYHKVGGDKYRRLGTDYPMQELEPPSKGETRDAAERFLSFGLKVKIGG
jgi:pyruvate formate lyase activating enzyme